jgi:hypothetical protein
MKLSRFDKVQFGILAVCLSVIVTAAVRFPTGGLACGKSVFWWL